MMKAKDYRTVPDWKRPKTQSNDYNVGPGLEPGTEKGLPCKKLGDIQIKFAV